jgi:hypothetical protein
MKNDLNKALRVISREIGDNFDIDKVRSKSNFIKIFQIILLKF